MLGYSKVKLLSITFLGLANELVRINSGSTLVIYLLICNRKTGVGIPILTDQI